MDFLFLGGHPAIDFLNTSFTPRGEVVETIGDGASFLDWLVQGALIDEATAARLKRQLGMAELDAAAAEARALRAWAREWLARWRRSPRGDYRAELTKLNRLLGRLPLHREVQVTGKGMSVVDRPGVGSPEALIGLIAAQLAALVTQEAPGLVKACAGADCSLWFVDRTKAHRRLFCSATACGNRAKVSAFRQRQRRQEGG